jgi:transcriptional regulator with XRE-family HTH domain
MPRPSSRTAAAERPYAELAARLRGLRVAAHLTQQRLGETSGLSRSAVQRCESGSTAPSPEVLRAYIDACRGTDADQRSAQTLRARGRAVHRGRLPLLCAPHPAAIRTRPDLHAALAAAYENAGARAFVTSPFECPRAARPSLWPPLVASSIARPCPPASGS